MALSVRIFGLSSWSILAPQALLGVATVGVLYASVRRTSGHAAGLLAGALLALTPAAALMFRFNNPDALLVFLLTVATYATPRATEKASARWLAGAGVLIGFAFLTKMLQAFLVLPAFALVYLLCAPTPVRRRILHLLVAFATMIIALGWWVAIVELVPASWRPYVGGSTDDSVLDLVFGYNGLGRIFGQGGGAGGGAGGLGAAFGGQTGITRLFVEVSGGMMTWLIPAALVLAAVALVAIRSAPRTDGVRAAIVVWTGWLVVTGLVFSFVAGTYHDYDTVALAPPVATLVAVAGQALWVRRTRGLARGGLAAAMIITAVWAFVLLGRATGGYDLLRCPEAAVGLVAALGLLFAHRLPRVLASVVLALAVLAGGTGPAAYTFNTVATPHQGSIVTAGPVSSGMGGPGGRAGIRPDGTGFDRDGATPGLPGGQPPTGTLPGGAGPGGLGGGGFGGETANADLVALLQTGGSSYRWAAATTGSQGAASYQLASGQPVMAIGGFTGSDPSPTLAQFQSYVATGQIHYYVSGGNRGGPGGRDGAATEISSWVAENYAATTSAPRPSTTSPELPDLTTERERAPDMTTVAHDHPTPHQHLPKAGALDVDAVVDIVVPAYSEEVDLGPSVRRLDAFLAEHFPYRYCVTIADNASTDSTWAVAQQLASDLDRVRAVHLDQKGRGRAHSRRSGRPRPRRCWPTWTSTCRPTCGPCCPCSRR